MKNNSIHIIIYEECKNYKQIDTQTSELHDALEEVKEARK